jgi:hypothetical protein
MPKFNVQFINRQAKNEYVQLDGSIKPLVCKALNKLQYRADEIGKLLSGKLHACKEVKLRQEGIRIIFRIVQNQMQIVQTITINKRANDQVFSIATKRLNL